MHVWRRQYWAALAALAGVIGAGAWTPGYGQTGGPAAPTTAAAPATMAALAPASPAPAPGATAAAISKWVGEQVGRMTAAANGALAASVRDEVYVVLAPAAGPAPTGPFVNDFASEVAKQFEGLTRDPREFTAMNATMLIAQMGDFTINTDHALVPALESKSAAVRYWAAKGLAKITPPRRLGLVPAAIQRVVKSLEKAIAVEKSPVVRVEMITAVKNAANAQAVLSLGGVLAAAATAFQAGPPAAGDLAAATAAASAAAELVKSGVVLKPTEETELVTATTNAVSLAAQQLFKQSTGGAVPAGVQEETARLEIAGVGVLNALKPTAKISAPKESASAAELMRTGDAVFGSEAGKGDVQKLWAGVGLPPALK